MFLADSHEGMDSAALVTWVSFLHKCEIYCMDNLNADADCKDLACCKPQLDFLANSFLLERDLYSGFRVTLSILHLAFTEITLCKDVKKMPVAPIKIVSMASVLTMKLSLQMLKFIERVVLQIQKFPLKYNGNCCMNI